MLDKAVSSSVHSAPQDSPPDLRSKVFVRPLGGHEISSGLRLASESLPVAQAPAELLQRVRGHNPDSLWGIFRTGGTDGPAEEIIGFCALLIMNTDGAAALLADKFDPHNIRLDQLAAYGTPAQLLYVWAMVAKGLAAFAVGAIDAEIAHRYRGCPLYATAGTEGGLKIMLASGFEPVFSGRNGLGALFRRYPTARLNVAPPSRTARMAKRYKVVPVATADDFEKALAIRNVFLSEQNCPYEEEFDGNDRMGTLFLGSVDGEPASTLRIRYFANFFKMERLAVLPRFRRTLIAKETVLAAVDFCRRKGYARGIGHAQKRLVPFWTKFGFKPTVRNAALVFSDHEYVEMYGDLEPHTGALTQDSDPYVLIRQEGRWDEPGVLDRSATRLTSNPS
jgi:predicted GNAT family N-acyltransferase